MKHAEILAALATAPSERAIAEALLDHAPAVTGATAIGYYGLDTRNTTEIHVRGMCDAHIDSYEREGRTVDALHAWVKANHVPARMNLEDLKRFPAFLRYARQHDVDTTLGEYMLAPIVHGSVVGMMHFASKNGATFSPIAMRFATAMSAHVSARVAVLRAVDELDARWAEVLSVREREVAQLAARGLSTVHMARAVGVSPNTVKKHLKNLYAKLHVGSRAELGATLVRGPEPVTTSPSWTSLSRSDRRPAVRKPGRRA